MAASNQILNMEQRAAVQSEAETTVVAAAPGSGKTKVLCERVRYRVGSGCSPKRMVIITYTNAAAYVLQQRLAGIRVGFVGTLHSYGMRLLQQFGGEIGYRAGSISIVTKETQEALLLATAKRLGVKCSKKDLLSAETMSANLVWGEYRHELKRSNMIDYSGILESTLKLLQLTQVREALHVDELFGDELQDSGAIDWHIFDAIPAARRFYVADADQSVFGFRGGDPRIFVNMAIRHNALTLSRNYRSDVSICSAATALIRHNTNRIAKPVQATTDAMGSVTVVEVENDTAEIFEAYSRIGASGYSFNECAILCRTNALADRFRTMMHGFGVAVKRRQQFPNCPDWSTALSVIGLLIDPSNNHHAEQVLRAKGWAEHEIAVSKMNALRGTTSLSEAAGLITSDYIRGTPHKHRDMDGDLCSIQSFGISQESMELIRKRVAVLPNENPTLSDLLSDLWNHDRWNVEDEGDGITVCTIHAGKGKEWDFVLVPGCEEGIVPHGTATNPGALGRSLQAPAMLEEERRLFFVAITRARHQLVLMHSKQRTAFGKTTNQEPSRFLMEIR